MFLFDMFLNSVEMKQSISEKSEHQITKSVPQLLPFIDPNLDLGPTSHNWFICNVRGGEQTFTPELLIVMTGSSV